MTWPSYLMPARDSVPLQDIGKHLSDGVLIWVISKDDLENFIVKVKESETLN